ncbi:MAG TPA: chitobiase/beta-hexosaminidase C-terminal domain-containing protein [Phycisphaerae bacterium]|nr:chitobiase/beta-hexosaminidase C-terminal domain-containing protein [Phycisphaerae bacterium]HRY70041.1 chitobiase/beta-hexosaminidase C-terminal domain-containing protein [Phycisphaerae bacterium]HSA27317.1 chitobiase/beta-hexosaminidase C-terminal domain-containing protein [Phycisphaerae bacterium]
MTILKSELRRTVLVAAGAAALLLVVGQDARGDIASQLVGWWTLDESSGLVAGDGTGNGNTITLANGPTWTPGKINNGLSFDGMDDAGSMDTPLSASLGGDMTIALWVQFDGTNEGRIVILIAEEGGRNVELRLRGSDGKFGLEDAGGIPTESWSAGSCADNLWHHIAVTRSGSPNPTWTFYLDGSVDSVFGGVEGWSVVAVGRPILGHKDSDYAKVTMDDLRLYNRALSADDVNELRNLVLVATPEFSPHGGQHEGSSVTVAVSCVTADATIHYTLDGTDPTESSPMVTSGSTVTVPLPGTLKAKAWKTGLTLSALKSASYTLLSVATPAFSPDGGWYEGVSNVNVTVTCDTAGAVIHYTLDGTDPTESSPAVASGSTVTVPLPSLLKARAWRTGLAASAVKSAFYEPLSITAGLVGWWRLDDGSGTTAADSSWAGNHGTLVNGPTWTGSARVGPYALSFDGSDDWVDAGSAAVSGDLTLVAWLRFPPGPSNQRAITLQRGPTSAGLQLVANPSNGTIRIDNEGGPSSEVSSGTGMNDNNWHHAVVTRSGTDYSLYVDGALVGSSGGTAPDYTSAKLGCRNSGLNGSFYFGQLDDVRLYRRALSASDVNELYTSAPVATPEFKPDGGVYGSSGVNVVVTCSTPGATIHYTIDDTDPTESSPTVVSGGTVQVPVPGTLKAKAWKTGLPASGIKSATYTSQVAVATPEFNPDGGGYDGSPVDVTVTCSTADATIRYTIDGTDPAESSPSVASGGTVSVPVPGTLKARAWKTGLTASAVKSASFTVADITTGLVSWWRLDESSGDSASDATGNGNTVMLVNGPTWTSGKIGNALSFDGTDDYGSVDSFSTSLSGDMTMALWVKWTAVGAKRIVIISNVAGNNLELRLNGNGTFGLDNSGGIPVEITSTGTCADETWHHIAVTRSGSPNPIWKFYLDGAPDSTHGGVSLWTVVALAGAELGHKGADYTPASIDDLRILSRTLAASEVKKLYDYRAIEYTHGDFDGDGSIDIDDLQTFETCDSGPRIPYAGQCAEADFDKDGDVDQDDFGAIQRCFSGPSLVADPACLPTIVYP